MWKSGSLKMQMIPYSANRSSPPQRFQCNPKESRTEGKVMGFPFALPSGILWPEPVGSLLGCGRATLAEFSILQVRLETNPPSAQQGIRRGSGEGLARSGKIGPLREAEAVPLLPPQALCPPPPTSWISCAF